MINSDICHASLFTGIGGFDLAAQWVGWKNIFQVEKDKWCRELLSKRFAAAKRYEDIKNFSGHEYYGKIDVISGGFPCQPFSVAGKQKGAADDRYLWPEMLRVISEVRPAWVVGENVAGIGQIFQYEMRSDLEGKTYTSSADAEIDFDRVCERIGTNILYMVIQDLEKIGYAVQTFIIPACGINAPHKRDRIWIVAHSGSQRTGSNCREISDKGRNSGESRGASLRQTYREMRSSGIDSASANDAHSDEYRKSNGTKHDRKVEFLINTNSNRLQRVGKEYHYEGQIGLPSRENAGRRTLEWPTEPPLCGANDGVSRRVDRLRGLGNSIVPQVAYEIFSAINLCITRQEGEDA